MNLAQILSEKAQTFGFKTAIRINQQERSFADLDRQAQKAAGVLKGLNIGKGDRVAFLLPKGLPFIELYLATLGLGAIALPLNPAYRPQEIQYFLSDSESSLVIIPSEKYAELDSILRQIPSLQVLVTDQEIPETFCYPRLLNVNDRPKGATHDRLNGSTLKWAF
jgi:acyl-CoA synthetase (AMP-forming)/AMP-acid ligase II